MGSQLFVLIDKMYLGLLLAVPLGPVSLEMIRRGFTAGFWSSFSIRLGGVGANLLCLGLTCFGLSQIHELSGLLNFLGFMGVALLFYLGYTTLSQDLNPKTSEKSSKKSVLSGLLWGFYLGIFNPVALAFWPGIFAATLGENASIGMKDFLENSFILVGILLWGATLSSLCTFGRRFFDFKKLHFIAKASGALILLYATKSLYHLLERIQIL